MKITSNRFLNEEQTQNIANMLVKNIASHLTIEEIELRQDAIAIVIVKDKNEIYSLSYEYNIYGISFLTVNRIS